MEKLVLAIWAIVMLWSCSSGGNTIIEEPPTTDTVPTDTIPADTIFVDSIISLDTAPKDFKGEVFYYSHLNAELWATLNTYEEMCEAASIPDDVLKRLTTEGLAQSCMYWPLYGNYFAYPTFTLSIYDGIMINIEHCNALLELAKREQSGIALLKLYKYFQLGDHKHLWDFVPIDQKNSVMHKGYLELLLTTDLYITKLDKEMLIELGASIERVLLQFAERNGGTIGWVGVADISYVLWQKVLLCYNKFTPILTDDEVQNFEQNIKYFGLRGLDNTIHFVSVIDEKKRILLEQLQ